MWLTNAIADTDYATPGYVNGQISAHDSASGAHADLFDAKLDKTGGTINGALDIANAGSLKFLNPNMRGMMLKTNVDGVVCEATPGTDTTRRKSVHGRLCFKDTRERLLRCRIHRDTATT